MTKPRLLICSKLIQPTINAENKLKEILTKVETTTDNLVLQGFFTLSISFYEYMIADILFYYLQSFPEKTSKDNYKIDKSVILDSDYLQNITDSIIEKEIRELTYQSIKYIFDKFVEFLDIDLEFNQDDLNTLNEMKETRNLLLHNNLQVNSTYLIKTGAMARKKKEGQTLTIDASYLEKTLLALTKITCAIRSSLNAKYEEYTYVRAIKSLWDYMFDSPVMKFEDYWDIDINRDKIPSFRHSKYENNLASSETTLLALWRMLFTGRGELKDFNYYSLDTYNRPKVNLLFELASDYWFWGNN